MGDHKDELMTIALKISSIHVILKTDKSSFVLQKPQNTNWYRWDVS